MDGKQKMDKAAMLARADQAVKKAGAEFSETLKEHVRDLEKAIQRGDLKKVVEMAYNLETEASTFGWPCVTRICKWLRKVFSGDYDHKPEAEDVLKVLSALKINGKWSRKPQTKNETKISSENFFQ